jgi:alpha-ketoglutarate-dependent 2,4-dichlorophenoxyacetate dioxygenase
MALTFEPVTDDFVAIATGIDLRDGIDAGTAAEIEAAMDRYAVLVWPGQPLDDDQHMAFTRWFGPLDEGLLNVTKKKNRFKHEGFVDIANVGADGAVMERDNPAITSSIANQFWHTDSSFLRTVAKYSMLSAQVIPAEGGDTEFADLRAAWDALPAGLKAEVDGLVGRHHALHSRTMLGNVYTDEQMEALPPADWPLVRTHPGSGRRILFVCIHIAGIHGMSVPEARMLVSELIEHATQPAFVYRHRWRPGDLVMWDNRSTLHRGRRWDLSERRELRRTTVMEGPVGGAVS